MSSINSNNKHIKISVVGTEKSFVTIDEVGLFLYDFATLYELIKLSLDPKYGDFKFSRFSLYRNGRHLLPDDRMYVESINHQSPIQFVLTIDATTVAAISVAILFLKTCTDLYLLPRNINKLDLEIINLESEVEQKELGKEKTRLDIEKTRSEMQNLNREELTERILSEPTTIILLDNHTTERLLEERNSYDFIEKTKRKLERSPIQIIELDADIIDPKSEYKSKENFLRWLERQKQKGKK